MHKVGQGQGAPALAPGKVIDGRYRVVRFVAEGSTSGVFEVEHVLTGRRLALKHPRAPGARARLEAEARAASALRTPRAVGVTDMALGGVSGPYLVMELLEGKTLRALLGELGRLPLGLAAAVGLQVAEALHEAHGRGVLHRALAPEHVFLRAPGGWPASDGLPPRPDVGFDAPDVKLLAFRGALRKAGPPGPERPAEPAYASLEQLRGAHDVDARVDVYALGAVLYECLAGRRPFAAEANEDLVEALSSSVPEPLSSLRPELPAAVCDAVTACLAGAREARPGSVLPLARSLAEHADRALSRWIPEADGTKSVGRPSPKTEPLPAAPRPGASAPLPPPAPPPFAGGTEARELSFPIPPGLSSPGEDLRSADRNTPTEMFPPAEAPPGPFHVRHDTPTRTLDPIEAGLALGQGPPASSGGFGDVEEHEEKTTTVGRNATLGQANLASRFPGLAAGEDPHEVTRPLPEGLALPPPPPVPAPPVFTPVAAPSRTAPKPSWQLALDRTLVGLARRGDELAIRARALPPRTRIAVVAGASFALVFFFALLFVRYALS